MPATSTVGHRAREHLTLTRTPDGREHLHKPTCHHQPDGTVLRLPPGAVIQRSVAPAWCLSCGPDTVLALTGAGKTARLPLLALELV